MVTPPSEHESHDPAERIVVVPVGSCEQHGPHLPVDTDTVIATALCRRLGDQYPNAWVAPPVTIAASGEHAGFPYTLSIGVAATAQTLIEIVRSADWAGGVLFVNGHGGNQQALESARRVSLGDGRAVAMWSPTNPEQYRTDLHAGFVETSVMLYLDPQRVAIDRAVAGPSPTLAQLRRRGVAALAPNGVLGDPAGANAADGCQLFDRWAADLAAVFERHLRWLFDG